MTAATHLSPQKSLRKAISALTGEIAAEHIAAQGAFSDALKHAVRCGQLLTEAKEQTSHGGWLPYLADNFDFSRQTASAYMRLFANREQIEMEGPPSISSALKQLAAPKSTPPEGDVAGDALREIAARIDSGELDIDAGRDLLWSTLDPFERYWLKHAGIVSTEEKVEAIRETCEIARILPMIEDLSALEDSIRFVWVGYVSVDGEEIGSQLTFHPGWARYCRDRLGEAVRFATADLMPVV